MNIFVTGATDVLGTFLVPRLIEAEYTFSAMSRTEGRNERLRRAGTHSVQVDFFDMKARKVAGISGEKMSGPRLWYHHCSLRAFRSSSTEGRL